MNAHTQAIVLAAAVRVYDLGVNKTEDLTAALNQERFDFVVLFAEGSPLRRVAVFTPEAEVFCEGMLELI